MKLKITQRQLQAIAEIATTIDAMIGCSDNSYIDGASDFNADMNRELIFVDRFFKKNGYDLGLERLKK